MDMDELDKMFNEEFVPEIEMKNPKQDGTGSNNGSKTRLPSEIEELLEMIMKNTKKLMSSDIDFDSVESDIKEINDRYIKICTVGNPAVSSLYSEVMALKSLYEIRKRGEIDVGLNRPKAVKDFYLFDSVISIIDKRVSEEGSIVIPVEELCKTLCITQDQICLLPVKVRDRFMIYRFKEKNGKEFVEFYRFGSRSRVKEETMWK